MAQFELLLPRMGESVAEATIVKWLKQPGDRIEADEPILEIATDKVDSDVPSPVSGTLLKQLFSEEQVAQVGDVIALIETEDVAEPETTITEQEVAEENVTEELLSAIPGISPAEELPSLGASQPSAQAGFKNTSRFYSPLVKSIAAEEGISPEQLEQIPGTGIDGRVTKQDILDFVQKQRSGAAIVPENTNPVTHPEPEPHSYRPATSVSGTDEIIEMDRMRKLIADHMVASKQIAPHVTSFVEADVTNIVKWRERIKGEFEKREGEKITFTPIFIEAAARAIRDFPMVNISLDGTRIIKKKSINIGMATALPSGNLIVPVIKSADQFNLVGLTKAVNDLANRARANKLQPDEVKDGTFTITNIGSFGNIMGTPIINQPQVAILAIGSIIKKPAVIETQYGDVIGIRHMMFLSLSYDHRIVDGALGGMFLRKIADYLEAWDVDRKI
ncbi:2-oxo acid dehydrogenase subunit E2 [Pedobacter sp. BS3]|uniref:dihydrolipoamide acetyltransferase family protein n=1 Tax=Pedobacter sp. BS3 TaxID=2567937 RepID=UPI0011EBDC10|nr:dihydrolipoamide acetyltransferase family protein [Pedobacter sp. BS3]TZF83774.1 2-oxo acid dehydrogenase subunit E2 [Pedobacter sp. BS3]